MESHDFVTIVLSFSAFLFCTPTTQLLSLRVVALAATSPPCHFPAIFNFGDSNSDTGGLSAAFGQARSPHGESYFHHAAGRYCDGRLIVDYIAESVGLPHLSAYLDSVGSNFSHGANFATAGSTIRPQNTTLHQSGYSPISLDVMWNEFYDFHDRAPVIRSQGGVFEELLPKREAFTRGLYTFDIGQNDLTAGYFLNMSTQQVMAYVPDVLNQFKNIIKNIYGQGGRNFWIHNTGPFGCLAYVLERAPLKASDIDKAGCGITYNHVAKYFNHGLKKIVTELRKELPSASITYVDVYSLKYQLFNNTRNNGFEESLRACCGHGGKYNYNRHIGCGGNITVHGKQVQVAKACEDPSVWINWDGVHYTQAANKWIFDRIVDGSYSHPPIPLKMACHTHPTHKFEILNSIN